MNFTPFPFTIPCLLLLACQANAALEITPTFTGAGYTPDVQQAVIDSLNEFSLRFSDDMQVYLHFVENGDPDGPIGRTTQNFSSVTYTTFLTALRDDATTRDDAATLNALPHGLDDPVPSGLNTPVPGTNSTVWLTRPHALALGLTVGSLPDGVTTWDATVQLNLQLMFHDRSAPDPAKYDLRSTVLHEVAEVLGTTSNLADFSEADRGVRPLDLFRYDSAGNRNFTTAGDDAWFSFDATRLLARFNQNGSGDYGDFWSPGSPADDGREYQVQDAFNSPGYFAEMNVELRMLDVVGFDPILPAPFQPELAFTSSGGVELDFYGVPFQDSTLEWSDDLTTWQDVGTKTATKDGLLHWSITEAPEGRAFFRIKE